MLVTLDPISVVKVLIALFLWQICEFLVPILDVSMFLLHCDDTYELGFARVCFMTWSEVGIPLLVIYLVDL